LQVPPSDVCSHLFWTLLQGEIQRLTEEEEEEEEGERKKGFNLLSIFTASLCISCSKNAQSFAVGFIGGAQLGRRFGGFCVPKMIKFM